MNQTISHKTRQGQDRALVSVLPAEHIARVGGAELSAIEQQLVKDFRQMSASSRDVMARFFERQASRDRESRIGERKSKFHVLQGGAK